jgi:hypothetical protein
MVFPYLITGKFSGYWWDQNSFGWIDCYDPTFHSVAISSQFNVHVDLAVLARITVYTTGLTPNQDRHARRRKFQAF